VSRGKPSNRRKAAGAVLAAMVALSYFSPMQVALRTLPQRLSLTQGQKQTITLGALTLTPQDGSATVSASRDERLREAGAVEVECAQAGTSELLLSLMGIPLRRVEVEVSEEKRLIPGGQAVGVAMRTQGVLVVGVTDLQGGDSPARLCGIRPGDMIYRMNGQDVRSAEELTAIVNQSGGKGVQVDFLREGVEKTTVMTPQKDESTGAVRMGAWVRDSTAGVGTLSFYDPETSSYGALGHAITDGDTGQVLSVGEGQILQADVVGVQKGLRGSPGELKGSFLREPVTLGDIRSNGILGIYGQMKQPAASALYPEGLPIGLRSGVHTGPAIILSTVDASGVQAFDVEITRVNPQSEPAPKSMVIRVTDPDLLEKTGGIVQGMSGSPIIQDGRIIGAVTHVFVSDPCQGYGLYIDWMLGAAGGS